MSPGPDRQADRPRHEEARATGSSSSSSALVGVSGYFVNLAVFAVLRRAARRPPHPRRDRRLLRRRHQQLLLEPPLDVRREARPRRLPGGALLHRQRAALGINLVALELLIRGGMSELPSQAIAVAFAMPFNFIGNKLWTFDEDAPAQPPSPGWRRLARAAGPLISGSRLRRRAAPAAAAAQISQERAIEIAKHGPERDRGDCASTPTSTPRRAATTAPATGRSASSPATTRSSRSSSTTRAARSRSRGPASRSPGGWRAATRAPSGARSTRPTSGCPLCAIFVLGLLDWRRPFRIAHLDLLVIVAGFGLSHFFFNRGDIGLSVPLAYPPLLYLLARALWLGFRRRGTGLRPSMPVVALAVATVFLIGVRVGLNVADSNVIDVGYSGVIGADRIADGEPLYGNFPDDDQSGDTYGPVGLLRLRPLRAGLPLERALGRPAGRPRRGDLLRPGDDRRPLPARPPAASRPQRDRPRRPALLRLGGLPLHGVRAGVEHQRRPGLAAPGGDPASVSPRRRRGASCWPWRR